MVRMVGVLGIEARQPRCDGRDHLGGRPGPQFGAGPIPRAVLIGLQDIEQRGHGSAGDLRRHDERAIFGPHPPDPAVGMVAIGVAERMLHVADERVVPVHEVEAAVGAELQIDRPEAPVVGLEQGIDRVGREARALLPHPVLQHALEADAVVQQIVALGLVGKLAAAHQLAAGRRPPLLLEERLQAAMLLRIVDVAGEGGAEVVQAPRGVGHEILPPAVEGLPPGVREGERHEHVELLPLAVVAKDAGVGAPLRPGDRFHRGVVERALHHQETAAGIAREGADRMVGVGRVEAVEDDLADVGPVVAVGVLQKHEVRLLGHVAAAVGQLEPGR